MKTKSNARGGSHRGLLLIVLSAVLWGTVGVAVKALYGLADTNPISIGFFRLVVSVPALLLARWFTQSRHTFHLASWQDLGLMLLIGVLMALYQVCYFAAIVQVGVAIAVLVTLCTAPVLVALFSAGLLREQVTQRVLLALIGALAGTALLVVGQPSAEAVNQNTAQGVLLALGSAFSYAMLTLCIRALARRYDPFQPITIGFSVGASVLLPFALSTGFVTSYPIAGWALLIYLGLVPTAIAFALFLYGMRSTTATTASIVTLLEPLTSTALAWLLFSERLGPLSLLGAVLLLGVIALLYRNTPS